MINRLESIHRSATNIISFLKLTRLLRLVSEHHLIIPVPEHPLLQRLSGADVHDLCQHLLKELADSFGVMQAKLV